MIMSLIVRFTTRRARPWDQPRSPAGYASQLAHAREEHRYWDTSARSADTSSPAFCAGLHKPRGQSIAEKMLFMVAAMAAGMERDLIRERTLDGLAAAGRKAEASRLPPSPSICGLAGPPSTGRWSRIRSRRRFPADP
jgi:hypothetical protein